MWINIQMHQINIISKWEEHHRGQCHIMQG